MVNRIFTYLKSDVMFTVSMVLAVVTSFFVVPDLGAVNWHTIFSLMTMMIWVSLLENAGVLHAVSVWLVSRSHHARALMTSVTLLSFFGAMLLSNDIAILTLMPIYLRLASGLSTQLKIIGSTLIIMAANSGAILFPFGKSQNLYLFGHYGVSVGEFFTWSASLTVVSLILMIIITRFIKMEPLAIDLKPAEHVENRQLVFLICTGVVLIATIFGWLPFNVVVPLILIVFFIYNRKIFKMVDYGLLATFLFFFVATKNLANIHMVQTLVSSLFDTPAHVLFGSFALSQIISNVPSTILISTFTDHAHELFLGTNIGGLGTMIASMANLIGFRVYRQIEPDSSSTFLKLFMVLNFVMAAVLLVSFGL
ncbi:citrate transporter [Weissella paramesenteroides]|uniref:SLC13 family permease n=1 Tax=Weissella paramesenteroides TaxID=1249 RepID=UPI0021AE9AE6|nr:SLC13 family permease [Weissella paramesenteroides]MCS9983624.1 citrate transporter [Weissella paramesenteroides]MCS9997448.1 citrate transporter [Weissella paramesenteroides]MCT0259398.1 citrate transporter [Weissella paramesenteroides]